MCNYFPAKLVSTGDAPSTAVELTQKRCEAKAAKAYLEALSGVQENESDIYVNVEIENDEPNTFSNAMQQGMKAGQEARERALKLKQQKEIQQALENIRSFALMSCMEEAGYRLQD